MKKPTSPAMQFVTYAWEGIPRRSWRNRNSAMHRALCIAIDSGMPFEPGDIGDIYERFNAGYWIGESKEGLYAQACESQSGSNVPAAISWEQWFGREPYLWAEKTRTPERLFVGARFTWKGHYVTVTSFAADGKSLTACTYKEERGARLAIGDADYIDGEHREVLNLTRSKTGDYFIHFSGKKTERRGGERSIGRRFNVPLAELQSLRKDYDARRRAIERELAACTELEALDAVWARLSATTITAHSFRHFDVEIIRESYAKAKTAIADRIENERDAAKRAEWEKKDAAYRKRLATTHDADLKRWLAGEEMSRHFNRVCLRRNGEWIETSTGQRATVEGVRLALGFVKKHRSKGWQSNGTTRQIDAHPLQRIDARGVQVGCTFVEWAEVDRISSLLKSNS